jgi:hypothetical protein
MDRSSFRVCLSNLLPGHCREPNSNLLQSHVIITDYDDQNHVHLFTADIPSAFLDRFDFPALVPPAPVPVTIRHTMVPFKPYRLLYSRLLDLILPDWYSSAHPENIEKVDGDDTLQKETKGEPDGTDCALLGGQGVVMSQGCQDGG